MIELEFLGRSGDARSVILTDGEGQRYSLVITDDLRTILRRDPALSESKNSVDPAPTVLRPSHIQAMLREGLSAEEIATIQGVPLDSITRYESPILAEKAWAISRARQTSVAQEPGSPSLEDLVINRLAARGVDHHSLAWDALRRPGEDWEVSLTFIQSAVEKTATWTLANSGTQVVALDQEAHWLTETASPLAPVSSFFSPVANPVDEDDLRAQESLVDQANALRGQRQPVVPEQDLSDPGADVTEDFPFFSGRVIQFDEASATGAENEPGTALPAPLEMKRRTALPAAPDSAPIPLRKDTGAIPSAPANDAAPAAAPPAKASSAADALFAAPAPVAESAPTPAPEKRRSKRRPVPSWDEIVFGARPE